MQTRDVSASRDATFVAGDLVQHFASTAPAIASLHQLPPPVELVGRNTDLDKLESDIISGASAGATIAGATTHHAGLQGMGGVGKTALAVVLAHRLRSRYPDAQLMLNLRGVDAAPAAPAEIMQRVVQSFHPEVRVPDDTEALAALYRSVLEGAGRVLLLFDNAADAEQVRLLLPPSNCLLLVTSRAQFQLPGLTCRPIDCLNPADSRQLLRSLAPRLGDQADEAAALCGHLPLALEVFAGTVAERTLYAVSDLLDRLRRGIDRLDKVDAAFALSCELLPPGMSERWALLTVFSATFDLSAAAAIWADREPESADLDSAREVMQTLVRASLVEHNSSQQRFRLHDLARHYAARQLTEPSAIVARLRHAKHYTGVGNQADELYLKGGDDVMEGLALFDRERIHLDAAFEWLASRTDEKTAHWLVKLVGATVYTGSLRYHPRERIRWFETQRDTARIIGDRNGESAALGNLGNAYAALGDARKAIEFYEQQLVVARQIGDRSGEGNTLGNLGVAYKNLGDAHKAVEFYQQALVIDHEIGDRRGECVDLVNLGNAYAVLGDKHGAIESYEKGLAIAREIGDRREEGNALGNLGNAYALSGDARKAIEFQEQRLEIAREIGDRLGEGNALGNLGVANFALGHTSKAIEFYEKQLTIVRENGYRPGEGNALFNSAIVLYTLGDRPQALARAEAALQIFESIGSPTVAKVRARLTEWNRDNLGR